MCQYSLSPSHPFSYLHPPLALWEGVVVEVGGKSGGHKKEDKVKDKNEDKVQKEDKEDNYIAAHHSINIRIAN